MKKVSHAERTRLMEEDPQGAKMVEDHVSKMLGFTVIFQQLAAFQKPLVFHNGLLDLMLIYKEVSTSNYSILEIVVKKFVSLFM